MTAPDLPAFVRARGAERAQRRGICRHRETWFDRVLCPDGWMHTWCSDCGALMNDAECCSNDEMTETTRSE